MTDVENVIIHHHVVPKKVQISPHVGEEASYLEKRTGKYVLRYIQRLSKD